MVTGLLRRTSSHRCSTVRCAEHALLLSLSVTHSRTIIRMTMKSELATTIAHARTLDPVGSPCTDVCKLDAITGLCLGCFRTRDEIRAWKGLSNIERLETFDRLLVRLAEASDPI